MTIVIDVPQALLALAAAVDERGADYIYPGSGPGARCRYYHEEDREVGCLVGLALNKLGFDDETLAKLDTANTGGSLGAVAFAADGGAARAVFGPDISVTRAAAIVFSTAQSAQDCGKTWGAALETANDEAAHIGYMKKFDADVTTYVGTFGTPLAPPVL